MSKPRLLYVTQEMNPYTNLTAISSIVKGLPQAANEKGMEIRVLMPRFGTINERRHRLHEVVRLSGMNIIVDDDDYPLIIKVASLPGARLQVYFLDNEEFFKRKFVFEDEDGKPFEDNQDRMVFFCKGVLETVKKFGWPPDLIHCHGWMTSLVPFYLKSVYKQDPIFERSDVIYSVYKESMEDSFTNAFFSKASINELGEEDLKAYKDGDKINLHKGAISYADALVMGSDELPDRVQKAVNDADLPKLEYVEDDELLPSYIKFYQELLATKAEAE
ncbi:MAG: glycogen/starch synthase [Saprospiraceae bacterium]|nr:glycogen/starch synthase [Saprospiraceae bacterium]